jgi:hypothetical protein
MLGDIEEDFIIAEIYGNISTPTQTNVSEEMCVGVEMFPLRPLR